MTSEAPCYPATLGLRVKWSSAAAFWAILDSGHLRRWSHPSRSLPLISCLEIMPTSENIIMVQKTVYFTPWKITRILCGDTANLQKHENDTKPVCVTCWRSLIGTSAFKSAKIIEVCIKEPEAHKSTFFLWCLTKICGNLAVLCSFIWQTFDQCS